MNFVLEEWISDRDSRKPMEIFVHRQELPHAVLPEQRRDVTIVDEIAARASALDGMAQMRSVARAFSKERQRG